MIDDDVLKRRRGRPKKESLINGLDWDLLRLFYLIAIHGGYAEAGRKIEKAQAYLTQRIQSLERALGYEVFIRGADGVKLTRKGEELFVFAEKLYFDLKGRLKPGVTIDHKKVIRIASTHALFSDLLFEWLMDFQDANSDIVFDLVGNDTNLDLAALDADLAIGPRSGREGVVNTLMLSASKKLYASQSYIDEYGMPLTLADLARHKLLLPNKSLNPYTDSTFPLDLLPKEALPNLISNTFNCGIEYCRQGRGIIGGYPYMKSIRESRLINILPEIESSKVEMYLSMPLSHQEDSVVMKLRDFMIKNITSL